jgi:HSP90 family molecular chaperone
MKKLHFQVDSRLATLLSQEYSSTEKALKELVDNAWDADAEHVSITLPVPMSDAPIVIIDDGTGMTAQELSSHYLKIASDRRAKRGKKGTDLLSTLFSSTGFGFTPSHFLFARAKEKVTKEKARPAYGFRCAQLPSLRRCSEGRHGGPSLAHRSSFGIHAKRPSPQHLHSAS